MADTNVRHVRSVKVGKKHEEENKTGLSLLLQAALALVFTILGVYCSNLVFGSNGRHKLLFTSCDQLNATSELFMATKSPYRFNTVIHNETVLNDCLIQKVYGLVRHGTRHPTLSHMLKWEELYKKLQLPIPVNNGLFDKSLASLMTDYGLMEEYCLASRFKQRYPALLGVDYSSEYYTLASSNVPRTLRSGLAFSRGLFESGPVNGFQPVYIETVDQDRDDVLRFHDVPCPAYDKAVTNNKTLKKMISSYLLTSKIATLTDKLSLEVGDKLSVSDTVAIFNLCVSGNALEIEEGKRWCKPFTHTELDMMGFYLDMKAYWKKGPGFPITGRRSVNLLKDIVTHLTTDQDSKVIFKFAHAETLLPLLSLLEIAPDRPQLLPDNSGDYPAMLHTSSLAPFAGNVFFALYNCHDDDQNSGKYVRILLNDHPVALRLCASEEFCEIEKFTQIASLVTDNWTSLQQLCSVS